MTLWFLLELLSRLQQMRARAHWTPAQLEVYQAQVQHRLRNFSWWMPELRLAASEPVEHIIESLNAWQPDMLIAYASMARLLANAQLAGQLSITPRAVFTSADSATKPRRVCWSRCCLIPSQRSLLVHYPARTPSPVQRIGTNCYQYHMT